MSKCENCGRFTDMSRQWYSDELGHGVCNRCAEPVHSVSLADRIGYDPELDDIATLLVDDDPFQFR